MKPLLLSFIILQIITCQVQTQKQGQERIDSLLTQLPGLKEDTNKVKLMNDLSFLYHSINPDEGIKIGKQSLVLAEKMKWKKGIAAAARCIGVDYAFGKGDFVNAQEYLLRSLKLVEELRDTSGIAACLVNLGFVYSAQPDYPRALEYYSKSLQLYTILGNKKGIGANLGNMAIIYMYQSNKEKALEYYLKALKLYEEEDLKLEIARILSAIGILYENQKNYKKALEYYAIALKKSKELGVNILLRKTLAI